MIDILIPIADNSPNNNLELKYCLRAIEKYGIGYGRIFIAGNKPDWIINVEHLPCNDSSDIVYAKARNIMNKVLKACESDISKEFLFFNDDFFLLSKAYLNIYPNYSDSNSLPKILSMKGNPPYKQLTLRTVSLCKDFISFEIHRPIEFNKYSFPVIMQELNPRYDYLIRSFYCNKLSVTPLEAEDLKINNPLKLDEIKSVLSKKQIFSTSDMAFNEDMINFLNELYPNKSKYEA